MARFMVEGDVAEYISNNAITTHDSTTFDDGRIKIRMRREVTENASYLSISELYIPGVAYRRGYDLVRLIYSLVERCAQDGLRLRLVQVYNKDLIKRLEDSVLSDVTPKGSGYRAFATVDVPRIADFLQQAEVAARIRDLPRP